MHQVSKQAANQFITFCRLLQEAGDLGFRRVDNEQEFGKWVRVFFRKDSWVSGIRDAKESIRDTPSTHAFLRSNEYIHV
jgi:hypothetical protein